MRKNVERLVSDIVIELIKNKITVILEQTKELHVSDNITCDGFFNDETFVCAVGKPVNTWLSTFVHEYCHFLQMKENCKEHVEYSNNKTVALIDDWIEDETLKISNVRIKRACELIRDLELDCEKRTVEKMKEYGVDFNEKQYIKSASAYIHFYNILPFQRTWFKKSPTKVNQILDMMPNSWDVSFDIPPGNYENLFLEHCT